MFAFMCRFTLCAVLSLSTLVSMFSTLVSAHVNDTAPGSNDTVLVPAASTFYLSQTETQFSINIANDSSDVYFYFASPAYSWVGVGFGSHMQNSLMLVMYPDADGNSTFSLPQQVRQR